MTTFAYRAATWCEDCALKIRRDLSTPDYPPPWDTNDWPMECQFDDGSDIPESCADCHVFLENALTGHGLAYVAMRIEEYIMDGGGTLAVLREWADFYGDQIPTVSAGWNLPGCIPDHLPVVFIGADAHRRAGEYLAEVLNDWLDSDWDTLTADTRRQVEADVAQLRAGEIDGADYAPSNLELWTDDMLSLSEVLPEAES